MIRVTFDGKNPKIIEVATLVNALLHDWNFYYEIKKQTCFDMCDVVPEIIADLIRESKLTLRLAPFSSFLYYADDIDYIENTRLIHINMLRSDWSIGGLVNLVIHQVVHAVNAENPKYSFGHGDTSSGNSLENTAPYWIGDLAEKIVYKMVPQFVAMKSKTHTATAPIHLNRPGRHNKYTQ